MRPLKLSKQEKQIEDALVAGDYAKVNHEEFARIAQAVAARRKDTVLNIRVNGEDLKSIKKKASKMGVKYQTFIAEVLHRVAHS